MATRTGTGAESTVQPKGLRVGLVTITSTFSPGAGESISVGDVIQMIKVPANSTPVFVGLTSTYVQATVSVGDGLSDNRYILNGSTSAAHAANCFQPGSTFVPYTYSTDDTIDITATLVSVSTIAGAFYLTAVLSMDPINR